LLGELEVGQLDDAGPVLLDPVPARDAGVEHPLLDVARHLLRADQHALQLVVVDLRVQRPLGNADPEARALEERRHRVLQRALRKSEAEDLLRGPGPSRTQSH
jgi:hypothetical protein